MTPAARFRLIGAAMVILTAGAAPALPTRAFERAELFAVCAGRMAALATHDRGFGERDPQRIERMRDEFELLLDLTLPQALAQGVPPEQPRKWRSGGWTEVAVLLRQVHYSFDAGRAERAGKALRARMAHCRAVLLPGAAPPARTDDTTN